MHAYSQTDFLELVSKTTSNAYMVIVVDPDLVDLQPDAILAGLDGFSTKTLSVLDDEGSAIVIFNSIEDALEKFKVIEKRLMRIPNIDLIVQIYYDGQNQLNLYQSSHIEVPAEQFTASHTVM